MLLKGNLKGLVLRSYKSCYKLRETFNVKEKESLIQVHAFWWLVW